MLKRIELENYRSYKKFKLLLSDINILVGLNGAGKTNILEAFSVLSFGRSFRIDDKKNVINYDCDYARIKTDNLEIFLSKTPRLILKAKLKGVPKKLSEFIGYLPSVVFSPETISVINGSPGERRRFLDIMISQVDKDYLRSLINFKKIKQNRNNLLQNIAKGNSSIEELKFWDKQFVQESKSIIAKRGEAAEFLNRELSIYYQKISDNKTDKLKILYINNFEGDLEENLNRGRAREIAYGGSIFGPHRDDLRFELNDKNMANFASRGELKSAVLSLKVTELNFLESKYKKELNREMPILLLDDIFSEFDSTRRDHLVKLILKYQSILTATDTHDIPKELLDKATVTKIVPSV